MSKFKAAERERYAEKKNPYTETPRAYDYGRIPIDRYGATLGTYTHWPNGVNVAHEPILNVGPVQVGLTTYYAGVIPKRNFIFLGRDGRLWRVDKAKLGAPATSPAGLDQWDVRAWADINARVIVMELSHDTEIRIIDESCKRYQLVVRAFVEQRIRDAAAVGVQKTCIDYARGICEDWGERDLIMPRFPTMRHALFTELALGLDAKHAAELIEMGALMEYKLPILTRATAMDIHHQGVRLLSQLCPAWTIQSYLTPWELHGTIDRLLRQHYVDLLRHTVQGGSDFTVMAGLISSKKVQVSPESE